MGFVRQLTGKDAAKAAKNAGNLQSDAATLNAEQLAATGQEQIGLVGDAGQQASALFDPYAQIGQQGINQAGFSTDPNAQFNFLQNNPLFQMGLDNANTQTNQMAAARGRLSAGDTLQQLNENAMLVGQPMLAAQKNAIQNQLSMGRDAAMQQANIGQTTTANQANMAMGNQANVGNLLGSAAAAEGAGLIGYANAKQAGAGAVASLAGKVFAQMAPMAAGMPPGMGEVAGASSSAQLPMPGDGGFGSNLDLSTTLFSGGT